ncbi:dermonecrotic toxin domain-containing protein [Pseudomonas putida]|uniref:Dermonecrotic toxin N-terminal domain-containing protein n=1 Tax=Pseudomonas putida TaxID=303 RepID=A0A1Q9R7S9_PSEPU|nr:DUF6543 domain-containing protein [Pseudomonas putida]OLS63479.1 hypothetical protein PSEMO_16180 [Pseudomonas putida]
MRHPQINPQGRLFAREHFNHFPRPDQAANHALIQWASQHGLDIDPGQLDVVTLRYQWWPGRGWQGVIMQKLGLTDAMLSNWQGESANNWLGALVHQPWGGHLPGRINLVDALLPGPYSVYNGLFQRSDPQQYGPETRVNVAIEALQRFIWNLDFHATYRTQLDQYWAQARSGHRSLALMAFIAACNHQVVEGTLDEPGRLLAWQAADLLPRNQGFHARPLNIYGYAATDILCLQDGQSPHVLLYIPGNASPLHSFASEDALKTWVARQCQAPARRDSLARHFALADQPDGLDFSGLHTALEGLGAWPAIHHLSPDRPGFTTDGRWSPADYVNYRPDTYSPLLGDDLFAALTERQHQRTLADAGSLITTRSDVRKANWRDYMVCTSNILAPLVIVVPELGLLFASSSLAQFSLALDRVVNGHNLEDQADNVEIATYGLLNAQPLILDGARRASALLRLYAPEFVVPGRVNGRLGYRLSPLKPPHLRPEPALDYFHIPADIAPLAECDSAIAGAVIRTPRFDGGLDLLRASVNGYLSEVVYDLESDGFFCASDLNQIDPPAYVARPGSRALVPAPEGRLIDHSTRTASLRALGVDLPLPVTIPAPLPAAQLREIPRHAMSLWLGHKTLDEELLANIANNAERLHEAGYAYRFYLSRAWPEAFEENLRLLRQRAPTLTVLPLEDQAVYESFTRTPGFEQYQAAIDGNGGLARNYSAASDVLRYHLLYHEGGLYMDVDDTLLAEGLRSVLIAGVEQQVHGESLRTVPLRTTADGLLLHPPVSNELLGMNIEYNGSMIGSHPGNPVLVEVMKELRSRYLANPTFFDSRPDRALDPQAFHQYSTTLNRLCGPGMLSDTAMRELPVLRRLREINNFFVMPNFNATPFIDLPAYEAAVREWLPLNRIARIGSANTWVNT